MYIGTRILIYRKRAKRKDHEEKTPRKFSLIRFPTIGMNNTRENKI